MRITRLELTDYKCFTHLVLDNLGDRVVLVGPNGCGKSSILEAMAVLKEFVGTYRDNKSPYHRALTPSKVAPAWPDQVPIPVRAGCAQATITAQLTFSDAERASIPSLPAEGATATVRVLRDGEVQAEAPEAVQRLFQRYDPDAGVGVIDYIAAERAVVPAPVRQLDLTTLGRGREAQERIELPRAAGQASEKFATIKQFIASLRFADMNEGDTTGAPQDSLAPLRALFARFFAPKALLGPDFRMGELRVLVRTPYGDHDLDQLSSGEKELFAVLITLFRIRQAPAVILYDEPERHLNAGLEAKLVPALDFLSTNNQLFIASHGLELIGSVPLSQIIALRPTGDQIVPTRYTDEGRTSRVRLLEDLGATVGLQVSARRVVFLEGKEAHADKRILDRLVGARLPGVVFVASGSSKGAMGAATRAGLLMEVAGVDASIRLVLDRDYRSEAEVQALRTRLSGRAFVWAAHEVENLLLAPRHVLTVLRRSGVEAPADEAAVRSALHACATALAERFACELAAYRLQGAASRAGDAVEAEEGPSARPVTEAGLRTMAARLLTRATANYSEPAVTAALDAARGVVAAALAGDDWLRSLPGKEILDAFRHRYFTGSTALGIDAFKEQIVSSMVEQDDLPADAAALIAFVDAT